MKLESIGLRNNNKKVSFNGRRVFRNTVAQLAKNNSYSLTEPNQRLITNSIGELAKIGDKKNVEFLLETAAKNKYKTSLLIENVKPKNDWQRLLLSAATAAAALVSASYLSDVYQKVLDIALPFLTPKEREVMKLKKQLLKQVDLQQIEKETKGSTKNFEKNLDYLIISSETTLEHKKYILKQLNYMMSNKYKINPQLADKKSIVLAEMVNDMAIATPDSEVPNIKAVNQKQHGMCAAISIVRKKVAYEDKPNYVDSIISELDDSNYIKIYDRNNLDSKQKIEVEKPYVDFKTAISKGYRIIDAATMYWMQVAQMTGENNVAYSDYNPFDKENFDVKTDTFLNVKFEEPTLEKAQNYYHALIMAKSLIEDYKANKIKKDITNQETKMSRSADLEASSKTIALLKKQISELLEDKSQAKSLVSSLLDLRHNYSNQIKTNKEFAYIPNEEEVVKKSKIKNFLLQNANVKDIKDEQLDNIYDLISYYHELNSQKSSKSKSANIRKSEQLYNIAAAFRYQILKSLDEDITLKNLIRIEGIPNKETLVLNHIDNLVEKLENDSSHSELIIKQIAPAFDGLEPTKENIIGGLLGLKELLVSMLTDDMDVLYEALMQGDRRASLQSYIDYIIEEVNKENKDIIKGFSEQFGIKPNKTNLIKTLENLKLKLETGEEKDYQEVFEAMGSSSQMEFVSNLYKELIEQLSKENNDEFLTAFLIANSLPLEGDEQAVVERLTLIESKISQMSKLFENCNNALRVLDNEGDVLFSSDVKDVIIKKLENEQKITPVKALKELQTHFIKIAEDKATDEFQSRQGKLKDKSLYNFTPREKQTLKETELLLDSMYSHIQKQLHLVQRDLKDSLEMLNQIVGVNRGHYWVNEGSSGLYSEEQIRVLEYMTGRPHYETNDLKKAIEKIKTTPYSGISSSSVFHDKSGWHAQYIADIEPIKIKTTDSNGKQVETTREVLFNDNSWGASEAENTWVDSNGLKRTDYSDNRGGTLGYITNSKYRNGNFVDRILNDMVMTEKPEEVNSKLYNRIKHVDNDSYSTPQYKGIILDGKSPETKSVSDKIHDALFLSNDRFISIMQSFSEKETVESLEKKIAAAKLISNGWKNEYEALKRRIFPIFGTGISSKEEYDKLADDDPLKVELEKIALKQRYPMTGAEAEISKVKTVKDLKKFNAAQKNRAINSFKYAFSKSHMVTDYLGDAFSDKDYEALDELFAKLNLNLTDEQKNSIGARFSFDTADFNGSAKTTVKLIVDSIGKDIDKVVTDRNAAKELRKFFHNYLVNKLYFNKSDLDLYELDPQKIEHVIKFIDRVYDPADDEEFVKIYRSIQDMTNEEFKEKVLSKVTPEDLGIKNITGYDVLKDIQRYDSEANNALLNSIWYKHYSRDIGKDFLEPSYDYDKFYRRPRLRALRNFNSLYWDFSNDLSLLKMDKLFNKYKARNLEKYGVYPAYPKIDYMSDEFLKQAYNTIIQVLEKNTSFIYSINKQKSNYDYSKALSQYYNRRYALNDKVEGEDYKTLTKILGDLATINAKDESIKDVVDAALEALELDEGSTWGEFLPYIFHITETLNNFESASPKNVLEEVQENNKTELEANKRAFAEVFIQPRYQNKVKELLNKLEKSIINRDKNATIKYQTELLDSYKKYHILNNPQALIDQYIKSCAKDSTLQPFNHTYGQLLRRAFSFAKLVEIQEILMEAVSEGIAINAKSKFDKYVIDTRDGSFSMGSDEMIASMTNQLIVDEQFETAQMFLNKLGLSERYVKFIANDFDYDEMRNILTKAHNITKSFINFQNETDPMLELVDQEMSKEQFVDMKILDKLAETINESAIRNKLDNEHITTFLDAILTIQKTCQENPRTPKRALYQTVIDDAKQKVATSMQKQIEDLDEIMDANIVILNFANSLLLVEDSEANLARKAMSEEFNKLLEYKDTLNSELQLEKNSDKI